MDRAGLRTRPPGAPSVKKEFSNGTHAQAGDFNRQLSSTGSVAFDHLDSPPLDMEIQRNVWLHSTFQHVPRDIREPLAIGVFAA